MRLVTVEKNRVAILNDDDKLLACGFERSSKIDWYYIKKGFEDDVSKSNYADCRVGARKTAKRSKKRP